MASPTAPNRYGLTLHEGPSGTVHERVWRAHPAQSTILRHPARFRVVAAGRRFGKTELASIQALQWAQGSSLRRPVWWVAPTYELCEPGFEACRALWPEDWIDEKRTTQAPGNMKIVLRDGGLLNFKSAEKDKGLRGRGLKGLIMEECGEIREAAWVNALRPTLTDTRAPGLFIGTPKGRTWFWRLAQRGLNPAEYPDHATFLYPTSANPIVPPAEVEALRRDMPDRAFRQEILAEFVDETGGVFSNPRNCVRGTLEEPRSKDVYVAGWDVAKHQDYSVLNIDRARDRHTVYFDRFQKVPFPEQRRRVLKACAHYKASLLMDATHGSQGDSLFEDTVREAEPLGVRVYAYQFTTASKANVINCLASHIGDTSTSWPDIPVMTNEMEIYEYQAGGKMGAPEGWHDDCVIAKALSVWLATRLNNTAMDEPLDLSAYY